MGAVKFHGSILLPSYLVPRHICFLKTFVEIGGIRESPLLADFCHGVFAFEQQLGGDAESLVLDVHVWRYTHDALRAVVNRGSARLSNSASLSTLKPLSPMCCATIAFQCILKLLVREQDM